MRDVLLCLNNIYARMTSRGRIAYGFPLGPLRLNTVSLDLDRKGEIHHCDLAVKRYLEPRFNLTGYFHD